MSFLLFPCMSIHSAVKFCYAKSYLNVWIEGFPILWGNLIFHCGNFGFSIVWTSDFPIWRYQIRLKQHREVIQKCILYWKHIAWAFLKCFLWYLFIHREFILHFSRHCYICSDLKRTQLLKNNSNSLVLTSLSCDKCFKLTLKQNWDRTNFDGKCSTSTCVGRVVEVKTLSRWIHILGEYFQCNALK